MRRALKRNYKHIFVIVIMRATTTNSNFYQVGASLPVDAPSYVKRQADEEFYQKLQAGKFCYVLNSRQMGKSSLRVQTMQRLQKEGTVCAAIDLTGIGKVSQQQWYGGIVYNLSESCQLEDKFDFDWQEWWQKHQTILSPVQCLSLFIEKVLLDKIQQPIVIFVDEIDKVLSQDFSTDDFFALIRFFQNQRVDNPIFQRLTFALLGVATPGDLIQNKTQTPFNIGEAIELHGFEFDEVEPLIDGLEGIFDNPQPIMRSILDWTGGQPFLTQKLCKFMLEESEKDNPHSVKEVVRSRIIENWESQDEPEHLRTIRDRILSSEQRAGYLLELYQQIQQQGEIAAKKNLESSELRLSGLVVQREGNLRVYNRVYQQVFNKNWVETQLKNLRPYSENFRFWVASKGKDESRLLQGKALVDAEEWAKDKSLGYEDKQFLAASREKEIQEKIAAEKQEAQLERERKDKEAVEKINLVLSEANKKAKRRIRSGSLVLVLTVLGAIASVTYGVNLVNTIRTEIENIKKSQENFSTLAELGAKLGANGKSDEAAKVREQVGLAYQVQEKFKQRELTQALLFASISTAHQQLEEWDKAEKAINRSFNLLESTNPSKAENLQTQVFASLVKANLLTNQENNKQQAINAYTAAYKTLKNHPKETNPFENNQIITTEDIESVHRGLLELQPNRDQDVWNSLKEHFYARLENSLKSKDWRAADITTDTLMLFIADREKERYLDIPQIEKFSCTELKKMDDLWVKNSNGNFGFSVQKEIWVKTKNRLGVKPSDWNENDYINYLRFANAVGWYNIGNKNERESGFVGYNDYIKTVKDDPLSPKIRGGLPLPGSDEDYKAMEEGEGVLFSRCDL